MSDILDTLGVASYCTVLDLFSGFHQIEIYPISIEKTAFSVAAVLYKFTKMPFGLENAQSNSINASFYVKKFSFLDTIIPDDKRPNPAKNRNDKKFPSNENQEEN